MNDDKIKIMIVEDHTIVREGIRELLARNPSFEVVGEAEDGMEAIKLAPKVMPDIILMDISMPNLDGLSATKEIKKRYPNFKVLILTIHDSEEYIYQILKYGADGYVLKEAAYDELVSAIEAVMRGKKFLSPSISGEVINRYVRQPRPQKNPLDTLTQKEREILTLIAEGYKNKEMADKLFVSVKTIEFHRLNLMKKLDIHNQAALIRFAIRSGMLNK